VQQLSEMEEVIAFKQAAENPERRSIIKEIWDKRLKGCQRNVEVWQVSFPFSHKISMK